MAIFNRLFHQLLISIKAPEKWAAVNCQICLSSSLAASLAAGFEMAFAAHSSAIYEVMIRLWQHFRPPKIKRADKLWKAISSQLALSASSVVTLWCVR